MARPTPERAQIPYTPYYCEENAWRLLAATSLVSGPAEAVLVSNAERAVACWGQRAAPPGEPVLWDYHVVVVELAAGDLSEARVWDPDCVASPVLPVGRWLELTFLAPGEVVARFRPRFRPVPRARWVAELATDRSHMRGPDGAWRAPPPPWDPPGAPGMNLFEWLDPSSPEWLDRADVERRWGR